MSERQLFQKRGLQVHAAGFLGKLDEPGGVLENLDCLEPGDLVEEPSATGVHQQSMSLHLEQLDRLHALGAGEGPSGVSGEPGVDCLGRPVEDDLDVLVAGGPRIFEQLRRMLLVEVAPFVAEPVEGGSQGPAPFLVPAGPARVAPAIRTPALDAVGAAPGGILEDLDFPLWRVLFEKLAVVGQGYSRGRGEMLEGVCQGHIAVRVVVSIGFAVGRDMDQLVSLAQV